MGNLAVHPEPSSSHSFEPEDCFLFSTNLQQWQTQDASSYGFSVPCIDVHNDESRPYSAQMCYVVDTYGPCHRMRITKEPLSCFSVILDCLPSGGHCVVVKSGLTSLLVPVNCPEMNMMIEPEVEVIAYHGSVVILQLREATKNYSKTVLFLDIQNKMHIGTYHVQVNLANLNKVYFYCCLSDDSQCCILNIAEDHYEEWLSSFHSFSLVDGTKFIHTKCLELNQVTWHDPCLHLAVLVSGIVIVLGELSNSSGRILLTFSLALHDKISHIVIEKHLFPVHMTSQDNLIAVLYRNTLADEFLVYIYTLENLSLLLKIPIVFHQEVFNALSNCGKITFSQNGQLCAVLSTPIVEESQTILASRQSLHLTEVSVFSVPMRKLCLQQLARKVIIANLARLNDVKKLPLPLKLKEYCSYSVR